MLVTTSSASSRIKKLTTSQYRGTGASAIYPLLGSRTRPKWKFAATDIDEESLQSARDNVQRNDLSTNIRLVQTTETDNLIPLGTKVPIHNLDFTMGNPPFFSSKQEMLDSAKKKQRPPLSACTGAPIEMVTAGGETAFVTRMIEESLTLKDRVQWYTSMVGKHGSLSVIVQKLLDVGCGNFAVTEFVQGSKTRRWGVAWSWGDMRPGSVCISAFSSHARFGTVWVDGH